MSNISDHFEINVAKKKNVTSKRGVHWGRIELPDWCEDEAEEKLNLLRKLFGDEYEISMTKWTYRGMSKENWK